MASELESWRAGLGTLAFIAVTLAACNPIFDIQKGQPRPICVDPSGLLIDDMEDGDGFICELAGRHGHWYVTSDNTSPDLGPGTGPGLDPTRIEGGARDTSHFAAHFTGQGFTGWGALMGLDLKAQMNTRSPDDASGSTAITFWMKSNVPVFVDFPIDETVPRQYGGHCEDSASISNCNDDFSFAITSPKPDWFQYSVPFAALTQRSGFATWDPRALFGIKFRVPPGAPFDVWVDDVRFDHCPGGCTPTCTDPALPLPCPAVGRYSASCRPAETDCFAAAGWCVDEQLIDDLEDDDKTICVSGGRHGTWFAVTDGTSGTLQPSPADFEPTAIPGGHRASHYAAHITGGGFTGWGAAMGATLNVQGGRRLTYDPGPVGGVRFWMKSNVTVAVTFPIPETTPMDKYGGTCAVPRNCDNSFFFDVASSGGEWKEYMVPFAALRQDRDRDVNGNLYGGSANWSPSLMTNVSFTSYASSGDFDIWVDDLRFYPCSLSDCLPTCPAGTDACPASGAQPAGCWPAPTDCATTASFTVNTAVWGTGSSDVWVVGVSTATLAGVIRHWDGQQFTTIEDEAMPPIWGVWGSGDGGVWAVADRGVVARRQAGAPWSATNSGTAARLVGGVWGSASNDVWAVAYPGRLRRWDGYLWTDVPVTTSDQFWDLWGIQKKDVWAVGGKENALHWDGVAWTPVSNGTGHYLNAVWGSDTDNFWAVGAAGAVTYWGGSGWSAQISGTSNELNGVWGSGPNDVWAVGAKGTIIHSSGPGTGWSDFSGNTIYDLYGVWGSAWDDVYAVGTGVVLHWNGVRWFPRS